MTGIATEPEALRSVRWEPNAVGLRHLRDNLHAFRGQRVDAPPAPWAVDFRDWAAEAVEQARWDDLLAYRSLQPNGAMNHPTEDHIMPLFAAMGAGGGAAGTILHHSYTHAILAMDAYRFD